MSQYSKEIEYIEQRFGRHLADAVRIHQRAKAAQALWDTLEWIDPETGEMTPESEAKWSAFVESQQ